MNEPLNPSSEGHQGHEEARVLRVSGMYQNYFLDYASYVILERAVPAALDGLKPVQRRILHSMRDLEDGRYHKVANLIGHTMKYHPHGDASIGDALVQLGQKELLIDMQGNWGNILTGDGAAAPRYIEARLSPFALEVVFNPKTTQWQSSYDGRGKEPIHLPVKFPLLLAQGVEGIAVGLSTKVLPHNFVELIDASIEVLKGKNPVIYPDFAQGGIMDVTQYNLGKRGGKVRVRAKIHIEDKKTLVITEIPFGTTTSSLIDSIIKANDKGKIKVKKIEDNTAEHVEVQVHLPPGVSPDKTLDALYAFTDCEVSISPLGCVILDDRPLFAGVDELLRISTAQTLDLLKQELEIQLDELEADWHFSSLEKIFIENRIYRDIEEAETWEEVTGNIRLGLEPFLEKLIRPVTHDDILRLTEIRIKRISKFDANKAEEHLLALEGKMAQAKEYLNNLVAYAIDYYKNLRKKYAAGKERRTEIKVFDDIQAAQVAMANVKVYVNRQEGFVGTSLKKDEFLFDCSDLDDLIIFRRDGIMQVVKVAEKAYVGKNILHVGVFRKNDERTVYNMIYRDGTQGASMMKRFAVTGVTRDKEYDLTAGTKGSEVLYFSANPNGEAEVVTVHLRALAHLKKLKVQVEFSTLAIKGRASKGNRVTKYPVKKVEIKEEGVSTLAPRRIWFDETVQRLNAEGRGRFLGHFSGDDRILEVSQSGHYRLLTYDLQTHFEEDLIYLEKWQPERPLTAVYFEGGKQRFFVKRFLADPSPKRELFISEEPGSYLELFSLAEKVAIVVHFDLPKGKEKEPLSVQLDEFIGIKGLKAQGNQLSALPIKQVDLKDEWNPEPLVEESPTPEVEPEAPNEGYPAEDLDGEGGQITLDLL